MRLNRNVEECILISKACAYSQVVLVLAVFVQDGVPALVGEGCSYLKGTQQQVSMVHCTNTFETL